MTSRLRLDLDGLGFEQGAHLLVDRALRQLPAGGRLRVVGRDPALGVHLRAWCRSAGTASPSTRSPVEVVPRPADTERLGRRANGPADRGRTRSSRRPPAHWGLAARGALVEAGRPAAAGSTSPTATWSGPTSRPRLYAHAAAAQWDPATAVDWTRDRPTLPAEIEAAVVQVMTYLVENEQAALVIPARLLARVHPHFREVQQLLAVQAADEARHVEVFTRRALLHGSEMGTSSAGGRASLSDACSPSPTSPSPRSCSRCSARAASSRCSRFLDEHAPDPVTRAGDPAGPGRRGPARRVRGRAPGAPGARSTRRCAAGCAAAVERRHDALVDTAGLNADVFDALVVLAAGDWTPAAIARGLPRRAGAAGRRWTTGRRQRLARLGFPPDEAAELSALHTRNFM